MIRIDSAVGDRAGLHQLRLLHRETPQHPEQGVAVVARLEDEEVLASLRQGLGHGLSS